MNFISKILKSRDNALAGSWMINSIAYSIVYPFIPVYLHQTRNLPMEQAGLIFPIMASASIFLPPVAGWLSDHYSRTKLMRIGQGGRAFLFLLLALMIRIAPPTEPELLLVKWLFSTVISFAAMLSTPP